jgi:Fic family protein
VRAGILTSADLAGYRNEQVYIRNARHVPPGEDALRDLMPAFFDLLREETDPGVRAVLGHFMFAYIHPYMDGNGRMGRFLMNVLLAGGGYPWTVIPVERRSEYMDALEAASTESDIQPFTGFLTGLVRGDVVPKSAITGKSLNRHG